MSATEGLKQFRAILSKRLDDNSQIGRRSLVDMEMREVPEHSDSQEDRRTRQSLDDKEETPHKIMVVDVTIFARKVEFREPPKFECVCMRLQRDGLPCSHIIAMLRSL